MKNNPYQAPYNADQPLRKPNRWRSLLQLNIGLLFVLMLLLAVAFAWQWISAREVQSQLPRRYAVYDVEYVEFNRQYLVFFLVTFFVFPNLIFLIFGSRKSNST